MSEGRSWPSLYKSYTENKINLQRAEGDDGDNEDDDDDEEEDDEDRREEELKMRWCETSALPQGVQPHQLCIHRQ